MGNFSVFLDVALSLTFFYLIASMFVSGITEFINTLIEKRSALLWEALGKLQDSWVAGKPGSFQDNPLVKFFEHEKGMIWSKATSYINASTFVSVLLDKMNVGKGLIPNDLQQLQALTINLEEGEFKEMVEILLRESKDLKDFRKKLSTWFDLYMQEVSGWYKRYTRIVVWGVAIVVTIALNLNSIKITQRLYTDPKLRESMVAQALKVAKNKDFKTFEQKKKNDFLQYLQAEDSTLTDSVYRIVINTKQDSITIAQLYHKNIDTISNSKVDYNSSQFIDSLRKKNRSFLKLTLAVKANTSLDTLKVQGKYAEYLQQNLSALGIPMGWAKEDCSSINFWSFIGWILTAAALSFGAPFWFDLLLKIVNIRNVVKQTSNQ
jgi:hypothetical protein